MYTLKHHVKSYSGLYINPLNIRNIISIYYRERLFCIFDCDYKYSLKLEYYKPHNESNESLVLGTGGIGIAFTNEYVETDTMTVRYKTENEVKQEIQEMIKLHNYVKKYDNEQNIKLRNYVKKYDNEQNIKLRNYTKKYTKKYNNKQNIKLQKKTIQNYKKNNTKMDIKIEPFKVYQLTKLD